MSNDSSSSSPIWDAEADFPELCQKIRDGLFLVKDPEIGMSVIQLGLIRNVTIYPDNAVIRMILTTPYCPYGPSLLEQTRIKAEEVLERPTSIDFGLEMWDFSMMEGGSDNWGLY